MSTWIIVAMIVTVIVIDAADVLSRLRRDARAAGRRLVPAGQARRKLAAGFRELTHLSPGREDSGAGF
jgi:hypothetical protein